MAALMEANAGSRAWRVLCDQLHRSIAKADNFDVCTMLQARHAMVAFADAESTQAEALGWAKATARHKYGVAWHHLEANSRAELLEEARSTLNDTLKR